MKNKWIKILALTLSAVLLCGCSNGKKDTGSNEGIESIDEADAATGEFKASDYVTLGQYKGLELYSLPNEEDIDIQTKLVYYSYAAPEDGIKDRAIELLDVANIDYEGKKDGVAFEGGTAQGANLIIGSGSFIDGFEEGLIGVMPGETVDLNLAFPEYYPNSPELAGQEVVFTVKVNFIAEMEDDMVESLGVEGVSTVEEFHDYIKDYMIYQVQSDLANEITNIIINDATFEDLPEELLSRYRQLYIEEYDKEAEQASMDVESYMEQYNYNYEEMLSQAAENDTKRVLVIQAIADAEGLNISDEELDNRMELLAQSWESTVDEMITEGYTMETYRELFCYSDVIQYLISNAVPASGN